MAEAGAVGAAEERSSELEAILGIWKAKVEKRSFIRL